MVVTKVVFFNDKVKVKYYDLKESTYEEIQIFQKIGKAVIKLLEHPDAGEHIKRDQIPEEYKDKGIIDLYKYNLSKSWTLLYYLERETNILYIVMIDWMDHGEYERLFKYKR